MYLFVLTHKDVDISPLGLDKHPRIRAATHREWYGSCIDLMEMRSEFASVYYDVLRYNHCIRNRRIYEEASFICYLDQPDNSLYSRFRLQRMYEISKRSKCLFVHRNSLDGRIIADFLGLKEPLEISTV